MSRLSKTLEWSQSVGGDPTAGNMGTTTGATYAIQNVESADDVGLQFAWSGTSPVGVISLAASNNYDQEHNSGAGATWSTIPTAAFSNASSFAVTGDTGNFVATLSLKDFIRAKWAKVTYTPTSGVGSIRCHLYGKG